VVKTTCRIGFNDYQYKTNPSSLQRAAGCFQLVRHKSFDSPQFCAQEALAELQFEMHSADSPGSIGTPSLAFVSIFALIKNVSWTHRDKKLGRKLELQVMKRSAL
jgi:hypothetical protein